VGGLQQRAVRRGERDVARRRGERRAAPIGSAQDFEDLKDCKIGDCALKLDANGSGGP
jgi:hypothetical protein